MVEQVTYDIVTRIGKIEIRRYPSIVIAQVDGYGDGGFGILFRYISGANRQKERVAMTAPVISERIAMTAPVLSDASAIAFVLPEGRTLETAPEPLDSRVQIRQVPPRYVATLRFSGRWSASKFRRKTQELVDALAEAAVKTQGGVFVMRYSGPYTPWFLRRNEVAVEVEWDGDRDGTRRSGESHDES
jgi:hypothetical protein